VDQENSVMYLGVPQFVLLT